MRSVGIVRDDSSGLVTNFVSDKDPEWYAKLYKKDGLVGGHVIMLDRAQATR